MAIVYGVVDGVGANKTCRGGVYDKVLCDAGAALFGNGFADGQWITVNIAVVA